MGISIRAEGLRVSKGGREVLAVDNLEIGRGEVWGLIGPNGAGKSTLLQVLALLEEPDSGSIFFDGQKIDYHRALSWRRQLAVVFQEALLLDTTVFNNVAVGLRFRGIPWPVVKERVERWLEVLRISHLAGRPGGFLAVKPSESAWPGLLPWSRGSFSWMNPLPPWMLPPGAPCWKNSTLSCGRRGLRPFLLPTILPSCLSWRTAWRPSRGGELSRAVARKIFSDSRPVWSWQPLSALPTSCRVKRA